MTESKARMVGVAVGAMIGAVTGAGTGFGGGPFGAVAVATVFTIIGAVWGLSAGPDVLRQINKWRGIEPTSGNGTD